MSRRSESSRDRTFLVIALTLLIASAMPAASAVVSETLYIRSGQLSTVDGRTLPALCYTSTATGSISPMGPALTLTAGDVLSLTVHNQDDAAHGFEIVGVGGGNSSVSPWSAQTFEFEFPEPGTWLYRDPVGYPLNAGLGLAGAVEVLDPASGYDDEFLWLLSEHSEDWMTAHERGDPVDTSVYRPNYFTINGASGGDIGLDPRAHLVGHVGDRLLIRVVNGGLQLHSLHFHGYHVQVIARNGIDLAAPIEKDTIAIPTGQTAEFVLEPHQPGVFPVHDHVVLSVTANGVYPMGMIVFTEIQP